MWAFLLGLLFGVIGKAVYDVFKEDQLPLAGSFNTGRLETLLDETRQTVRDMRDEVRQAVEAATNTVEERTGAGGRRRRRPRTSTTSESAES